MVHVAVHLTDGAVLEETVEAPRGSERSFASSEDVVAKFMKLTAPRISPQHAGRLADMVLNIDRLSTLGELLGSLAKR